MGDRTGVGAPERLELIGGKPDDDFVLDGATGPYAWVRHPMCGGGFLMLLGVPVALGSWWGVLVFIAIIPAVMWRLLDEEKFLARNLPGYAEYQDRVRFRLLPLVW
jgi:protein-S-isoprenylcysteine O-methyltransferase Ste14